MRTRREWREITSCRIHEIKRHNIIGLLPPRGNAHLARQRIHILFLKMTLIIVSPRFYT
jgi:hypothetical protein